MKRLMHAVLLPLIAALPPVAAQAAGADADYTLVIADHRFQPENIAIPSGKKIRLLIENRDDTPEEFDSHDLNREKVVTAKSKATVFIGPLKPGRYKFQGEFHAETAQGVVVVAE